MLKYIFPSFNFIYKRKFYFSTSSDVPVFDYITQDILNNFHDIYSLDDSFDNSNDDLLNQLNDILYLLNKQSKIINYITLKTEDNLIEWNNIQKRSKWRLYFLDINPFYWLIYFIKTKLLKINDILPTYKQELSNIECLNSFNSLTNILGQTYFLLDNLNIKIKQKLDKNNLKEEIFNTYIQLLGLYNDDNNNNNNNNTNNNINKQVLEISNESINTFYKLIDHKMFNYLKELQKQSSLLKPTKSKWLRNTISLGILSYIIYYFNNNGINNIIIKISNEVRGIFFIFNRFFHDHLEEPIHRIYRTIRYDESSLKLGNAANLNTEVEILGKMIIDYLKEIHPEVIQTQDEINNILKLSSEGDISIILNDYAQLIPSPIKESLFGPFLQLILIQVHKLKVDAEKGVAAMDMLLRANELNFQLLTLVPAGLFIGLIIYYIIKYCHKTITIETLDKLFNNYNEISKLINIYNINIKENKEEHNNNNNKMNINDYGKLVYYINTIHILSNEIPKEQYKNYIIQDSKELLNSSKTISQKLYITNKIFNHILICRRFVK